jgi:hypothetical protein
VELKPNWQVDQVIAMRGKVHNINSVVYKLTSLELFLCKRLTSHPRPPYMPQAKPSLPLGETIRLESRRMQIRTRSENQFVSVAESKVFAEGRGGEYVLIENVRVCLRRLFLH